MKHNQENTVYNWFSREPKSVSNGSSEDWPEWLRFKIHQSGEVMKLTMLFIVVVVNRLSTKIHWNLTKSINSDLLLQLYKRIHMPLTRNYAYIHCLGISWYTLPPHDDRMLLYPRNTSKKYLYEHFLECSY